MVMSLGGYKKTIYSMLSVLLCSHEINSIIKKRKRHVDQHNCQVLRMNIWLLMYTSALTEKYVLHLPGNAFNRDEELC